MTIWGIKEGKVQYYVLGFIFLGESFEHWSLEGLGSSSPKLILVKRQSYCECLGTTSLNVNKRKTINFNL